MVTLLLVTDNVLVVSGHIIVTCLPPISTKGMTKEDMPDLMEEVRAQMMEVYTKTSSQVRSGGCLCVHAIRSFVIALR